MSWSTLHRVVAKVRSYTWRTKRRLKFAAPALATNSGFPIGYPPFASSTLTILRHGLPLSFLWVSHCTSAPDDLEQNLAHYLFLLIKLYWYLAMPLWIYVVYGLIGYSGRVDDRDQKYCQWELLPIFFLSLWISLLWTFYINGIIQAVAFCVCSLSLSIMISGFIHIVACVSASFPSMLE